VVHYFIAVFFLKITATATEKVALGLALAMMTAVI
jgi:hypothetical protein